MFKSLLISLVLLFTVGCGETLTLNSQQIKIIKDQGMASARNAYKASRGELSRGSMIVALRRDALQWYSLNMSIERALANQKSLEECENAQDSK